MKNRIHIFTGHLGSGKTEVALNFALQEKKKGEDVVIGFGYCKPLFQNK